MVVIGLGASYNTKGETFGAKVRTAGPFGEQLFAIGASFILEGAFGAEVLTAGLFVETPFAIGASFILEGTFGAEVRTAGLFAQTLGRRRERGGGEARCAGGCQLCQSVGSGTRRVEGCCGEASEWILQTTTSSLKHIAGSCDCLQGVQLGHSLGGGPGSGILVTECMRHTAVCIARASHSAHEPESIMVAKMENKTICVYQL